MLSGTEDGAIFRLSHDGRRIDRVAHTGGRPLGLELHPDGRLSDHLASRVEVGDIFLEGPVPGHEAQVLA